MKKLFLLVAFTGIIGAASATSFVSLNKATVITFKGDDKKGDDKKKKDEKSCDKDKACCKKDGKDGKSCCKKDAKGTAAAPVTTPAPAKK